MVLPTLWISCTGRWSLYLLRYKKAVNKLLDEYIIESKSHHSKEEVMSTSSEESNPAHEKGYNDLCKNDNRT